MKKRKKGITILLIIFLGISTIGSVSVHPKAAATSEPKELKPNVTYSYDLDGDGKKEKIKYTFKYTYSEILDYNKPLEVWLYIDGKKKFSKSISNAYYGSYSITDLDKKDGRKDLFLMASGDSDGLKYSVIQQYQNKKIKNLSTIKGKYGYAQLTEIGGISQVDGKGNFSIYADTPILLFDMGSYWCHVPFTIKNQKVQYKKTNIYNLAASAQKYDYVPNRSIKVYGKADKSSKAIMTLTEKDKVNLLKIKVGKVIDESYGTKKYDAYAYVKINNKKKGWIYFSNKFQYEHKDKMFKEVPAWG